jgi:hypothetical protein
LSAVAVVLPWLLLLLDCRLPLLLQAVSLRAFGYCCFKLVGKEELVATVIWIGICLPLYYSTVFELQHMLLVQGPAAAFLHPLQHP